ncbi:glycosyltransferase, partial [Streptomyces hydrogenans]|uniref:UDP-N-acetylglucosamine--N-acetylmuramyl- (pentapeptide) pyrophosphoryl-undecaprenol N-acetylglucosamine transferase n=1 Tax=Streptomyces hydrogenans TaxID=1873719 RepID=UPI00368C6A96
RHAHEIGADCPDLALVQISPYLVEHSQEYVDSGELPDVLALADVVISRSGAGTLAELTALGKPAVFVPLATSAGNEQAHNARHLEEVGAAVALVGDVSADRLKDAVGPLLTDPGRREAMGQRAREQGRPDAADRLVDVLLSAAAG